MKTRSRILPGLVLLIVAPLAKADIQDGLDSMFMTTGGEPAIYESQRRLGVDLGTFRLRAPINKLNVVNLTPPTLRAGCGGIDLYGGSFTFINAEQFRQMLRQIGANALGYAFKLALATMCEKCDSILTGLQNKVDALNRMQVDSCRWASGLVNDFTEAMKFKVEEDAVQKGSAAALFEDTFDAWRDLFENPGAEKSGGDPSGADPSDPKVGNYTWNALRAANAEAKFSFPTGSFSHMEVLMNIAGTYILRAPSATETQEGDLSTTLDPRLKYEDLKRGKMPEAGDENLVPLLDCDELIQCLEPSDGSNWSFNGINAWVTETLTEAAMHMADPSTASTDHSADMQNFLATLPLTVVRHMQVMQGDEDSLLRYVDHIEDYVSAAYASTLALAMVDVIRTAYDRSDTPNMPDVVRDSLRDFENDAKADRRQIQREYSKKWRETEVLVAELTKHYGQAGTMINAKE